MMPASKAFLKTGGRKPPNAPQPAHNIILFSPYRSPLRTPPPPPGVSVVRSQASLRNHRCSPFPRFFSDKEGPMAGGTSESEAKQGRKIVVAVDEGEESHYALSWCLDNVATAGDTLVLLHAMPTRVVYTAMDGTGFLFSPDIVATMEKYGREVADAIIDRAKQACVGAQDIEVETVVKKGDPRDVICETVEKIGADMLVIGSHGYGLIKRAFLGSVSSHCAQNVKHPVLIVKSPRPAS